MRLSDAEARRRFASARVLRLATVGEEGRPHQVPATFALMDGRTVVTAVDHKPKRRQDLRRVHNIRVNPQVSLLVDHYADDWRQLWWVRVDGTARVLGADESRTEPVRRLAEKYPQYGERPPGGPVIVIEVARWSGWAYAEEA